MGGPVIVMPGQQYPAYSPPPTASLQDLARALQEAQAATDPFAGFLPPADDAGWDNL
jgi:hypothetical protein